MLLLILFCLYTVTHLFIQHHSREDQSEEDINFSLKKNENTINYITASIKFIASDSADTTMT